MKLSSFLAIPAAIICAFSSVCALPSLQTASVGARETQNVIGDIVNLLNLGLVTNITASITLQSLETNLISVEFTVKNPLIIELTIDGITSSASLNGTTYATFTHSFPQPVVVPILGTANSGTIPNVTLTQGALGSLDIIPFGILDLQADVKVRGATINGKLGIPVDLEGLKQEAVPTAYNLDLGT